MQGDLQQHLHLYLLGILVLLALVLPWRALTCFSGERLLAIGSKHEKVPCRKQEAFSATAI